MKTLSRFSLLLQTMLFITFFCIHFQAQSQTVTATLQPSSCGKDALISSCVPCGQNITNYGNTPEFNAMAWTNGTDAFQRSLIQFDLSFIPAGSTVSSATISLFADPISSNGQHSALTGPNDAYLYKITNSWLENTVTWDNKPATTYFNAIYLPPSTSATQDYTNLNATAMVQDFVNNPSANYGMMLQMATETIYRRLIFASSDHPNAALRPRLVVNYVPAGPAPLVITSATTTICPGSSVVLNATVIPGAAYQWLRNNVPVAGATSSSYSASTSGSYSVDATVSCGLTYTSTAVQLNQSNVAVSFSGLSSSYFCVSPSSALSGQPAGGSFSGTGVTGNTFTPATAGVGGPYSITYAYTAPNGCVHTAVQPTTVTSGFNCALPQNVTITNVTGTSLKVNWTNASAPLMEVRYRKLGTNGYNYSTFSSTACNTSHTLTALKKNTTYLVSVRTKCTSGFSAFTSEISVTTLNARIAMDEPVTSDEVVMYPSPASSWLNFDVNASENRNATIAIYDLTGKLVLSEPISCTTGENTFRLDISSLKAGNYLVRSEGLDTEFRGMMVKE